MPNYKPLRNAVTSHSHITNVGTVKILVTNISGTTNARSLHDTNFTEYSVPTGKKLVITSVSFITTATAGVIIFYEDATNDAGTGTIVSYIAHGTGLNVNTVPTHIEFATGKFVTVAFDTTAGRQIQAIGEEIDA